MDIEKNYNVFHKYLVKLIGEESTNNIVEKLGGEDVLKNATYATTSETGLAYDGSLVNTLLELAECAVKINDLLPESMRTDAKIIYKVCLLSQLSKAVMFVPNTNQWEIDKRGMKYTFANMPGALRVNERSALIAMNAGVHFTEFEYEAMHILDKMKEEDNFSKYFSNPLTVVLKNAIELINAIHKNNHEG